LKQSHPGPDFADKIAIGPKLAPAWRLTYIPAIGIERRTVKAP
jgi:hypothetical protein